MRGPRVYFGLGLEGIPPGRHGLRHPLAGGLARERKAARADLHSGHQGTERPRREHLLRADGLAGGNRPGHAPARPDAGHLRARRPLRRDARHPDCRHQVRIRFRGWRTGAGRRSADARFFALLAGRHLPARRRAVFFDKQFVRDYLESIHWNKQPPAPPLPEEVAARTGEKYRQAYHAITGREL